MKKSYKSASLVLFMLFFLSFGGYTQNAWVNEFHYDNAGGDVGEFVEVVVENPGNYTLSQFSVVLYNGSSSSLAPYDTKTLDAFTVGNTVNNFTFYYYNYPADGIQNGAPDGIALVYGTTVISGQFLGYEGVFTAASGPAQGMTSVDIGVMETSSTPIGHSLQLTGTGTLYSSFTWEQPAAQTPGALNNGQSLGGAPLPEPSNYPTNFTAEVYKIQITLDWTDATGAQLPSKYLVKVADANNITPPVDGVPVADDLDFSDGTGALNVPYGEQTCSFYPMEGQTEYFFKIFPYTNAGANINYKTDGTAPSTSETTVIKVHFEDFENNSFGTWTTYSVASDKDWAVVNFGGAYSTTFFAQMNGYQENEPSNDWLISPALNMNVYGNEQLEFFSTWRFGDVDTELKLKYSTNYAGGDPTQATWTEISFIKPPVQDTWTSSGDISLAGVSGTSVHLAFQYLSSGNPRRWGVDEILISEGPIVPSITVTNPVAGAFWEKGEAYDITWFASNTLANVMIELTTDASAPTPTWSTLVASVPASSGAWTWLIPTTQTTSDDCKIRISDFTADVVAYSEIFSIIEPIYIPQLVITEIMYNPPEGGTDSLEFIELYNFDNVNIDLEGYTISSAFDFTFPAYTLTPGSYFLLAVDSVAFQTVFGLTAWQFDNGALNNTSELIVLSNSFGMIVDSVRYSDVAPWPTEPDGDGPSLTFCDPGLDNGLGENWDFSIEFAAINADGDTIWASPAAGCSSWPVADFEADITIVTTGGSVNFTDLSTGDPDTWIWTFIGGEPGAYVGQTPPPVTYNTPGTYNVALFISNAAGTSTREKTDYIQVGDAPVADFSATPVSLYAGESVDFTDQSANAPTSWAWTFEGGTPSSSTDQNPSDIVYAAAGVYDVTLSVTNAFGTSETTKEDFIDVMPVGVGENAAGLIQIYPNPNNGAFNLKNPSSLNLEIKVYNMTGTVVRNFSSDSQIIGVDIESHGKGIYFVRITDLESGQSAHRQVVVR